MQWRNNDFGGLLLELESGNIAVNGGASLADMEKAYICGGKAPTLMIVTSEHQHRARNADRFCLKHHVPLFVSRRAADRLNTEGVETLTLAVPGTRFLFRMGVGLSLFPVRYDSAEPFGMTFLDGETLLGIVPDGKILPGQAGDLFDCDAVILGNRLHIPENAPSALKRRLKSVYNTRDELDEIFRDYTGEITYI